MRVTPFFKSKSMKSYIIKADWVHGVRGKLLTKGEVHPASEFRGDHISDLVSAGIIEDTKPDTLDNIDNE